MEREATSVTIAWNEISQALFDEARERLWTFTASVFAAEGTSAGYRGTATLVMAGGVPSILTAAHVWRALPGEQFALSLEADRSPLVVGKEILRPTLLTGAVEAWGPDLALLAIPDPLLASRIRVHKAFFDLDRRRTGALRAGYRQPLEADAGRTATNGVSQRAG